MLGIKNVSKSFGTIKALKNISLDVKKGEFVFLTGPSGSGKTTLLRIILGEIKPDVGGVVMFEHQDVAKLSPKTIPFLRRKIGVVFQDFKVLSERTVRENVEVALAVLGLSPKEWEKRISHVLRLVSLENRGNLFPSQLSGGELQRVSLARALAVNPVLILADEPTGNLDWKTAEEVMELFDKINKEGKTILVVTHNKLLIEKYTGAKGSGKIKKRVVELVDGEIKEK